MPFQQEEGIFVPVVVQSPLPKGWPGASLRAALVPVPTHCGAVAAYPIPNDFAADVLVSLTEFCPFYTRNVSFTLCKPERILQLFEEDYAVTRAAGGPRERCPGIEPVAHSTLGFVEYWANGRGPADPVVAVVPNTRGGRIRFRVLNAASVTNFKASCGERLAQRRGPAG
jgi:hypothetical protein